MDAVETGMVLLFTDRVMSLINTWTIHDVILSCLCVLAMYFGWGASDFHSRTMHALARVMRGIVLKTIISSAGAKDTPLALAHLLCIFLVLHALEAADAGAMAKYVFADQIANALADDLPVGLGLCAALQSNMPALASMPRLQECAQLVVAQLVVQWFRQSIPDNLEFATTLVFMHLVRPALGQPGAGPILTDMYTWALYKAADKMLIPGAERWVQAAYAGLLWNLARDPISQLVGQFACVQVVSSMVLDACAAMLRTDPILSAWFILAGLGAVLLLTR